MNSKTTVETVLWGDGVHDDTNAIQERIDKANHELVLPAPDAFYLISRPLELPSDFRLALPRFAEVRLAAGSNCFMLKNKTEEDQQERVNVPLWEYVNELSPDHPCRNIEVCGGVWNYNNMEQAPNPQESKNYRPSGRSYTGFLALFFYVDGLRLTSMTFKDPAAYAVALDAVTHFTVDHIVFDFNYGNPRAVNMDGIHLDGLCRFGEISDLKGACYDDLVALNADEATKGPISDITIRGLYAEGCHSAVRILSAGYPVTNIHISDVYGTFYQYGIGLTKFYATDTPGVMDGITLDHIYASKAPWLEDKIHRKEGTVMPIVWVQKGVSVGSLRVSELHRVETEKTVETILVEQNAEVRDLVLDHITNENRVGGEMPVFVNRGTVHHLSARDLFSDGKPVTVGD